VRRFLTITVLVCLTGLAALYPVIEFFDRWDVPGPSSDTELQIIAVLTLVGIMFVIAHLVTLALSWLADILVYLNPHSSNSRVVVSSFRLVPIANTSPPLALRI